MSSLLEDQAMHQYFTSRHQYVDDIKAWKELSGGLQNWLHGQGAKCDPPKPFGPFHARNGFAGKVPKAPYLVRYQWIN
jgi:hypothetical protein